MSRNLRDLSHCNPGNWKLGVFYFCREDSRILVPKRIRGLGWTVNLARPLAIPFFLFGLAFLLGIFELIKSFGNGGDALFAMKVLGGLGFIALCYWFCRKVAGTFR